MTTWYVTRASGAVALTLLTLVLVLGVADVTRYTSARWPRFAIDALHRNVSLLAVVFVTLHVVTTLLDRFASIDPLAVVIPFASDYRPLWLALGTVSCDLLIALVISSLARRRFGRAAWKRTHWLAYACWPLALVHGLGTGSDASASWLLALSLTCVAAVLIAVWVRALTGPGGSRRTLGAALGTSGLLAALLIGWLLQGPLAPHWARRAGTPPALLDGGSATR